MKKRKFWLYTGLAIFIFLSAFMFSCSEEYIDNNSGEISLIGVIQDEDEGLSRAYWEHNEGYVPLFTWKDTKIMKCIVYNSKGKLRQFGQASETPTNDNCCSTVTVIPSENDRLKAELIIDSEFADGKKLEVGDKIYFYSTNSIEVECKDNEYNEAIFAYTTDSKTRTIIQKELSSTEHLSDYILIEGKGIVKEKNGNLFSEVEFRIISSIFRFEVINGGKKDLVIDCIKMDNMLGSPKFEKKYKTETGEEYGLTFKTPRTWGTETIKVGATDTPVSISPGGKGYIYTLAFPGPKNESGFKVSFVGSYEGFPTEVVSEELSFSDLFEGDMIKSNRYYTVKMVINEDMIKN